MLPIPTTTTQAGSLPMNKNILLAEQLNAQRSKSESQREQRQVDVMHRSTSDLIKQGIEKTTLQTGDAIPRIKLKNTSGNVVDVFDLLKSGVVVLVFYRGSWCPYCNLTLRAYQGHDNSVKKMFVKCSAIGVANGYNHANSGLLRKYLFDVCQYLLQFNCNSAAGGFVCYLSGRFVSSQCRIFSGEIAGGCRLPDCGAASADLLWSAGL